MPTEQNDPSERVTRPRQVQISLRRVFAFVMLAVIMIWVFRWMTDVNPTDALADFEKAKAFHGSTATIGPNQIRIVSVVRNLDSGKLVVESLRSESLSEASVPRAAELKSAAPWLDIVQLELSAGTELVDILDLRVFDHASRQSLTEEHPWCGFRVADPNLVHLYAIGGPLPEEIDLWLRVHSYVKSDPVRELLPRLYASVMIDDFEVTIIAAQSGYQGWTPSDGLLPVNSTNHSDCAFVLDWQGPRSRFNYQVAAYGKSGRKFFHDGRVNPHITGISKVVVDFPVPLEQIDHLEIRRHGGRHCFNFDGVKIPASQVERSFAEPPKATRDVSGKEVENWALKEFLPLRVNVAVHDGDPFSGSASGWGGATLTRDEDGVKELGRSFTLTTEIEGLAGLAFANRY